MCVLQNALKFYKQFAAENALTNPRLRRDMAKAHAHVAEIQQRLGHLPEAEAAFQAALEIYGELQAVEPDRPDLASDAASAVMIPDGAEEGGRTAMENLLQKSPDINLVYTINEPAAAGAYEALKAAGKEKDVTIVSVDGGCPGVENVKSGIIGATSQQYPLKMAEMGVDAVAAFAKDGTKPQAPAGQSFIDTGVTLITDKPVDGVESKDTAFGLENCWG